MVTKTSIIKWTILLIIGGSISYINKNPFWDWNGYLLTAVIIILVLLVNLLSHAEGYQKGYEAMRSLAEDIDDE